MREFLAVFRSLQQKNPNPGRTCPECPAYSRKIWNPEGCLRSVRPSTVAASCSGHNFCIRIRIGMIFISKSIVSTRRTTFMLNVFRFEAIFWAKRSRRTPVRSRYPSDLCLVGRATSRLVTGLHSDSSNFCIRTRIGTIFISKSTVSTIRTISV